MTYPLWPYIVVMTGKEETPTPFSQPQNHPQPSQKEPGYGVRTLDSATSLLLPVTQFSLQTGLMGYSSDSLNTVATSSEAICLSHWFPFLQCHLSSCCRCGVLELGRGIKDVGKSYLPQGLRETKNRRKVPCPSLSSLLSQCVWPSPGPQAQPNH